MEGAITAASHAVVPNTVIRNGKDCGAAHGSSKESLDNAAEALGGSKFKDATAAAFSGLVANRVG